MFEIISDFLKTQDVEYKFNARLADISPIKIGGNVRVLLYPNTLSAMLNVLRFLQRSKFDYKIVGRTSNILFIHDTYDTVIIKTDRLNSYSVDNEVLSAECGVVLASVASKLVALGYGGISELCGIPASIGGLVRTCAGAYGKDISDVLISVDAYDPIGDRRYEIMREDIAFSYRSCPLDKQLVILGAKIRLQAASTESVMTELADFRLRRIAAQPIPSLSLGSIFKRPSGTYAAKLIDEAGLKGCSVGGAMVSEKHAGFIINSGNATANDVLTLMDIITAHIYSLYNVRLEPEIEMF